MSINKLFVKMCLLGCVMLSTLATASIFEGNTRSAIDVSAKAHHVGSHTWTSAAIGLDLHQVFTGAQGDIGTLTLQSYLLRIDGLPNTTGIFDDQHDWALEWRIANFNYTAVGHGRFNFRVGHFELPFGLEQVVQTNGTLYQVQTPTGLKADWGISINGRTQFLDYEFAYMTGSGNELDIDDTGLAVGRIGTPNHRIAWIGLSYMDGEVQASLEPVKRRRRGLDAGIMLPLGLSLRGEFVQVREPVDQADHGYAELRWQNPPETLHIYSQWRQTRVKDASSLQDERSITLGVRYEPNRRWSVSALIRHQLQNFDPGNQVFFQLRHRFQDVL